MSTPIIVLTIFNLLLLAFSVRYLRALLGHWRKVLAALPTPMLGFASSYGVYAFNLLYVPPWVAVVMAAAFEVTYVGIAALDGLDAAQRRRGQRIAFSAAMISFLQNGIAAVFHSVPELRAHIGGWSMGARIALYSVGALLHAAQVWVAYNAANFTLHRPDAQAVIAPHRVKTLTTRPTSMRRSMMAPKQAHYPAPERVNIEPLTKIDAHSDDPRAADVRRLRDIDKLTYNEIALQLGLKSRQSAENLYKHGRTYAPRKKEAQ